MTIGINCDMGEAYSIYRCGDDEGIMPFITSANVACGFHASDPVVIHRTVELAREHGVKVGAHPSFPDRDRFGRRVMKIGREGLRNVVIYQVAALKGFLDLEGVTLKPHQAARRALRRRVDGRGCRHRGRQGDSLLIPVVDVTLTASTIRCTWLVIRQ